MQLALRPYATAAGVTVIVAGLIHVTPTTGPRIEQRAVDLVAAEDIIDLLNPIDAGFSTLMGADGSALASVTDALTSGGGALGAEVGDALPSAADLQLLDPAFWELFWFELTDPDAGSAAELLLVGAIEQLPVVGPLLMGFGVGLFWVSLLAADAWSEISQIFGIEPSAAASTALTDVTSVFGDAAGVLDPTTLVQDVSTAFDPSSVASILDLNPIADVATAIDPAAVTHISTVVDAATIADLGGILTNLIP